MASRAEKRHCERILGEKQRGGRLPPLRRVNPEFAVKKERGKRRWHVWRDDDNMTPAGLPSRQDADRWLSGYLKGRSEMLGSAWSYRVTDRYWPEEWMSVDEQWIIVVRGTFDLFRTNGDTDQTDYWSRMGSYSDPFAAARAAADFSGNQSLRPEAASNPLTSRSPESTSEADSDFQEGAATAMWADLWATEVEQLRDDGYDELYAELSPGAGGDWLNVIPEPPRQAYADAEAFQREVEQANNLDVGNIDLLSEAAAEADGADIDEEEFGHYLMMEAIGHGVGWFDDHARFPLEVPHWEASAGTMNAAYDLIEAAKEEHEG